MSEKIEGASTKLDGLKWLVVAAITVAAIYANSYFATESLLIRVVGLIIAAAIAGWIAIQTARGRSFLELCLEARTEIRKVVWPTQQETTQTAIAVFVFTLVMALFFWGLDSFLLWLTRTLVGSAG